MSATLCAGTPHASFAGVGHASGTYEPRRAADSVIYQARAMVAEGAGSEDPILQRDFYNSLLAAFTVDEVRDQVSRAGLALTVSLAGVRHMAITGRLT
jgi:hypothetical protein